VTSFDILQLENVTISDCTCCANSLVGARIMANGPLSQTEALGKKEVNRKKE